MNSVFPNKAAVERLRQEYPAGTRLELDQPMNDPYAKQKPGDRATVQKVDDAGHILCAWDMGSTLNLIPGVDNFHIVPTMPDEVRRQILAVRAIGKTNMFAWPTVLEHAKQCDFEELAVWLPANKKLYTHFILTGETEARE
jgi:hypothetical protein